jgi:hypothetical protein
LQYTRFVQGRVRVVEAPVVASLLDDVKHRAARIEGSVGVVDGRLRVALAGAHELHQPVGPRGPRVRAEVSVEECELVSER